VTARHLDWWTPGCFEAAQGVFRIPLSMPNDGLRAVNVYAIDTPDGLVLIDGGWHVVAALEELDAALRSIGRALGDVSAVFVTHIHRDHYTLAVELRRRTGAPVYLGRAEAPGLVAVRSLGSNVPVSSLRELTRAGASELGRHIAALTGAEAFDPADWEDPDGWLDPGPIDLGSRRLDVVATPGHTKGHVVFHDLEAGLMFTGDHILPTITPSIGFELGDWGRPLGDYLASLSLMMSRPDAVMMPAHGHPGGSVHERTSMLLAHHEHRLNDVLKIVTRLDGRLTGAAIATELPWTRHNRAFATLDAFNQMIAVCETLAHLDVLVDRGALVATTHGDGCVVSFTREKTA
jgi:glyoxylase-like metal-dependent hydrolase (beta-lactamase superfamily II)